MILAETLYQPFPRQLKSASIMADNEAGADQNVRYLDLLIQRNPNLIKFAAELHQQDLIPVNTFVLDLDGHVDNAKFMIAEARRYGIKLYYMSKQIARNPIITQAILNTGFEGVVTVEPQELRSLVRYGIKIGHVGHLVNIPELEIDYVLKIARPEVITVYNVEKAKMISDHAAKIGIKQKLLIRPVNPRDILYPYMEGGIPEEHAIEAIQKINSFPNVKVEGVTSFPCLLYDLKTRRPAYMPNIDTLNRVAKGAKEQGVGLSQINTPPMCITKTIEFYAKKGATHLEPGMGMTGMSPWQLYEPEMHPEIQAAVYVTEVSHMYDNFAYVYGGGFGYIEIFELAYDGKSYVPDASKLRMKALVGRTPQQLLNNPVDAEHYHGILDYHAKLYQNPSIKVGDTVVYGYRAQMFTTRAQLAVVSGLKQNEPQLVGLFDHANNLIDRHGHLLGEEKTLELMRKYT